MKSYITKKNGQTYPLKLPLKCPESRFFIDVFVPVHIIEEDDNQIRLVFLENDEE